MSLTINCDLSALDALIDGLGDKVEGAIRPAAQAGAQVLYNEVKKNVAAIGKVTGNLDSSIYQAYSRDNSEDGQRATYHISWNHRKAPHGHLVEYGHIKSFHVFMGKDGRWYTDKKRPLNNPVQVAARPFIRPAMAKFDLAMEAAKAELFRHIDGVAK